MSDLKAVTLTASGSVFAGRTRVKAIYFVDGVAAGSVVLKDGGVGGTTLLDLATPASATSWEYLELPGEGILFSSSVYLTLTNATSVTVFLG
jgi:hypothetical protein